jgi:hypothetical protein
VGDDKLLKGLVDAGEVSQLFYGRSIKRTRYRYVVNRRDIIMSSQKDPPQFQEHVFWPIRLLLVAPEIL